MHPEVVGGTWQALTERGDGRSLSASPPPCRRRREETLYLSLSLPRPSDERSQSLVTSSPTDRSARSLAQRLGTLATSLDLIRFPKLFIRGRGEPGEAPRKPAVNSFTALRSLSGLGIRGPYGFGMHRSASGASVRSQGQAPSVLMPCREMTGLRLCFSRAGEKDEPQVV